MQKQNDLEKFNAEKIAVANTLTLEALIILLEQKGFVKTEEIINLIKTLKAAKDEIIN